MTELENIAKHGYSLQWYLTDIAKYLALWSISEASRKYGFKYVLGGGTGLNDIYFPRNLRRFSRDIDLYLINVGAGEFTKYVNLCLKNREYYRTVGIGKYEAVIQGLTYKGVRGNNTVYKFRIAAPKQIMGGRKIPDILPFTVKKSKGFNKWWLENKHKLPRVYEIEVTVFKGEKTHANPLEEKIYKNPAINLTKWIELPPPFTVTVFALEDLLASKVEAILSGLISKGVLSGKIGGRRTVKVRDVYDLTIAFLVKNYSREKLVNSLNGLNIDLKYGIKSVRLVMLQTLIDPNKFRELVEYVPHLRGKLREWVSIVLTAYSNTLELCEQTPEDYMAYKIVVGEKIRRKDVIAKFRISEPQVTHVINKLEKLGFPVR